MLSSDLALLERRNNLLKRSGISHSQVNSERLGPKLIQFELARCQKAFAEPASEQILNSLLEGVFAMNQPVAALQAADFIRLRARIPDGRGGALRQMPVQPFCPHHEPTSPALVERVLHRFFEWVRCDSFEEMHPLEQMSICQMRLLEILPFSFFSPPAACLFATYFPLAAGHLLPVPDAGETESFLEALDSAYALSTEPLVRFNLQAALRSHDLVTT